MKTLAALLTLAVFSLSFSTPIVMSQAPNFGPETYGVHINAGLDYWGPLSRSESDNGVERVRLISDARRTIRLGETANIHQDGWVRVLNPYPLRRGGRDFRYGDFCTIRAGGLITAFAFRDSTDFYVRLAIPRRLERNDACPRGTIFHIRPDLFLWIKRINREKERERGQVAEALRRPNR